MKCFKKNGLKWKWFKKKRSYSQYKRFSGLDERYKTESQYLSSVQGAVQVLFR